MSDSKDHAFSLDGLRDWYDRHAENYDRDTYAPAEDRYGGDRYRVELVLGLLHTLKPGCVLDIGCGTCEPMMRMIKAGFNVRGFDLSPGMIDVGRRKLADAGHEASLAEVGDLLDEAYMATYARRGGFDAVLTNGVLPYIADDRTAHRHLAEIVRPGGHYIGAYSNRLFDLVTLNRFTVKFHGEMMLDRLDAPEEDKRDIAECMRGLLSHPDLPRSIPGGARDDIFVRGHNPFEVEEDLRALGFRQVDMVFYRFHAFPPLVSALRPRHRRLFLESSRAMEMSLARDWRGMFMASTFIGVYRKE